MIRWLSTLFILTACSFQPNSSADLERGKIVYERACARCHDVGLDGAQIIGDREGWHSRLSLGVPLLVKRSIEGYEGAVGHMPARGDDPSLSDREVASAVRYLVDQSR